jgi:hypothetical protein
MARQKLILVASESMDKNQKPDRDEDGLIRMSSVTRKNMQFSEDAVEVCPAGATAENQIARTKMLRIFKAFAADVKAAKAMMNAGDFTKAELKRIGFVTTKTLNSINGTAGRKQNKNIWVSDSIENTVLGADPEFLLFDRESGNIVRANSILSKTGYLGSDGAMAEIRPRPATTTEALIVNMKKIFESDGAVKHIDQYKWSSGCYYKDKSRDYPIGGHIHVGTPMKIAKLDGKAKEAFFRALNKILDELIALPLIKLDGVEEGKNRRTKCQMCTTGHGGYGFFGEMRIPNGRLEHRTLSGMWLTHPSIAKAVFGTAKAIIDEVFKLAADNTFDKSYMCMYRNDNDTSGLGKMWQKGFKGWEKLGLTRDMQCTRSSDDMIKFLNDSDPTAINASYLNKWLSTMKSFSTYKDNSKYIHGLYEILKISAKQLQEYDREIQKNWLGNKKFMVDL